MSIATPEPVRAPWVRPWGRATAGVAVVAAIGAVGIQTVAAVQADDAGVPSAAPRPATASRAVARAAGARAGREQERRELRPSDALAWPVPGRRVTGRFGEQRAGHVHEGIDLPMPAGTPIRAAAPGRVVLRAFQQGYGRYTCIAHRRITTCYGHQSRFGTKLGARVRRGQIIGYVGDSGDTDAYHLHFEVRRGTRPWGTPANPLRFLPPGPGHN